MNSRNEKASGLMGDLESIKALLEEDDLGVLPEALSGNDAGSSLPSELITEQQAPQAEPAGDATGTSQINEPEDIPVLQEAVPGAQLSPEELADLAELERDALAESAPATATPSGPGTPAATHTAASTATPAAGSLDALLGEEFHSATAEVMSRARALINQHANQWSPQQTDELADALRVRIDGAVHQWIQTSLAAHSGELQQRLLNAVRDELARHLEAFESAPE